MQRTALVIGATGLVGRALVHQLASLYEKVIIIARKPPTRLAGNMHVYQLADFTKLHDYVATLNLGQATKVDAFSCLGSTLKQAGDKASFTDIDYGFNLAFATACQKKGIRQFYLLSAMGADADSRLFYLKTKGQLEDAISGLGFDYLAIFRPSLLIGKHDNRPLETLAQLGYRLFKPLLNHTSLRPIAAEQVAVAMAWAAYRQTLAMSSRADDRVGQADNPTTPTTVIQIFNNEHLLLNSQD